MLSAIFTVLGIILLAYILVLLIVFAFKVGIFGFFLGSSFIIRGVDALLRNWWAWLVQIPFVMIYFVLYNSEGIRSAPYIALMQLSIFALIAALQKITSR